MGAEVPILGICLGLQVLAGKARRVADDVERTRSVLGSASGRDLGAVGDVHRAVVDRWTGGLGVGSAAADQLAGEICACAAEYQARDEGTTVVFDGLDR